MNQRQFEDSTSDKWFLKEAKFDSTCEQCQEQIRIGEMQWLRPEMNDEGRKVWHARHARHGDPNED